MGSVNILMSTDMSQTKQPKLADFEKSLDELEKIVARMERGEQPLEAMLQDFERGMALSKQCGESLDNARQRVEQLLDDDGEATLQPLESPSNPENEPPQTP